MATAEATNAPANTTKSNALFYVPDKTHTHTHTITAVFRYSRQHNGVIGEVFALEMLQH
jgi:hypothetical protein